MKSKYPIVGKGASDNDLTYLTHILLNQELDLQWYKHVTI